MEDMALAVERIDTLERQQRLRLGRGRSRFAGERVGARADVDLLHRRRGAGVLDRAVDKHVAVIHHRDGVGELKHAIDVVLYQQDRHVDRGLLDQATNTLALGGSKAGERLVEQQDARLGGECQRHVEQPLAAIGQ